MSLVMGATKLLFEQARTEGREQGRQEGRQEVTDRWKAWYEENKAKQPLPPPPPDPEHNGTN